MKPTRNNTSIAHENGAIEAPHGHFKRRLSQQLYLRGSFEFESVAAYQAFIESVIATLNGKCTTKFEIEKQHLQPLPKYRFADYDELTVRVSCYSTIEVRCVLYTVPSRLIGRQLTVRLYHDRLVGYVGKQVVVELARIRGASSGTKRRARCINYCHIIEGLRRKPRAFLYCTWQQEILPTDQWRQLWQQMVEQFDPDSAARVIVEALYIAATQDKETAVADYVELHLRQGNLTLSSLQQHFQLLQATRLPQVDVQQHELLGYDQLLNHTNQSACPQQQPEPKSVLTAQTTATVPYAEPLVNARNQSSPGGVVVFPVLAGTLSIRGRQEISGALTTSVERGTITDREKLLHLRV